LTLKKSEPARWSRGRAFFRSSGSSPLVTVIMAVKDAASTVEESVGSIQRQSIKDWELLIIDDGSTDGSLELIRRLARTEARADLLTSPSLGPAGARNLGIAKARGRYIAILDSDDIAVENRLERQIAMLEGDPTLAALGSAAFHFVRPGVPAGIRPATPTSRSQLESMMRKGTLIVWSNSTMCWRKEPLDALGGFDTRFAQAEDAELMNRAVYRHAMTILGLPDSLVWYRLRSHSLSSARLREQRMFARYLELRNRCWIHGTQVPSLEDFLAQRPTLRERARWGRHDLAAYLYREAGYRIASGVTRGVSSKILVSALIHPRYVIPKLWRQRLRTSSEGKL
jgi:glycosyltransferase involved in cell wall biosynthesis